MSVYKFIFSFTARYLETALHTDSSAKAAVLFMVGYEDERSWKPCAGFLLLHCFCLLHLSYEQKFLS